MKPPDKAALTTVYLLAVANEHTTYQGGYAESTSLDGLIAASEFLGATGENSGGHGVYEPMEVDSIKRVNGNVCF